MPNRIRITVYRIDNAWYHSRWVNDEWDGADELDIPDDASTDEAIQAARDMPLRTAGERDVRRVPDYDDA